MKKDCSECEYFDEFHTSRVCHDCKPWGESADAVQGEWIWRTDIPIGDGRTSAGYICSNCGKDYWHGNVFKYCPSCGARMKGGAE